MEKQEVITQYQRTASDTGSPEVQVALLTNRIHMLTEHLKTHKKDHSTRMGLLKMVGQRKRLLRYLSGENPQRYQTLIASLNLRK